MTARKAVFLLCKNTRIMKRIRLISLALFIVSTKNLWAWGPEGHKMVAEIAREHLSTATRDSVEKYLGVVNFEEASVWMDEVKSKPEYDYMKPWHYVNVERDKTYVKNADGNIVNVLLKVIEQLKNRRKQSITETGVQLKMLFHLVGDIHQPLHVGYGEDRGGNDIRLKFLKRQSNLHRVWDEDIITEKNIRLKDCLALEATLTEAEKKAGHQTSPLAWMAQSRALLPEVYAFQDNAITQAYIDKNAIVVEKQILIAGLNLAAVLEEIFKK